MPPNRCTWEWCDRMFRRMCWSPGTKCGWWSPNMACRSWELGVRDPGDSCCFFVPFFCWQSGKDPFCWVFVGGETDEQDLGLFLEYRIFWVSSKSWVETRSLSISSITSVPCFLGQGQEWLLSEQHLCLHWTNFEGRKNAYSGNTPWLPLQASEHMS